MPPKARSHPPRLRRDASVRLSGRKEGGAWKRSGRSRFKVCVGRSSYVWGGASGAMRWNARKIRPTCLFLQLGCGRSLRRTPVTARAAPPRRRECHGEANVQKERHQDEDANPNSDGQVRHLALLLVAAHFGGGVCFCFPHTGGGSHAPDELGDFSAPPTFQ